MSNTPKTENFVSTHVRLITFLVTVGVFLLIFGPIAVMEAKEYFGQQSDPRPQMTAADLIKLSEQYQDITPAQLDDFRCRTQENEHEVRYDFEIVPHYHVYAIEAIVTGKIIYCEVVNLETGAQANVLTDDIAAFFAEN